MVLCMSRYILSSGDNDSYEPYKPNSSYRLENQNEGPFFSCNHSLTEPHFHLTNMHPHMDNSEGNLIIHQLHVPGYDEHDGNDSSLETPPFHIITGWHITGVPGSPVEGQHVFAIDSKQKLSPATDNQEALMNWNIGLSHVFENGGRAEKVPSPYDKLGDPSISQYAYTPHNPGESIFFTKVQYMPRIDKDGKVTPAKHCLDISGESDSEDHAKNIILDYVQRIKNAGQHNIQNKIKEDPGYWNDLFNRESNKIYTIDDDSRIVSEVKYHPWTIKNASCSCSNCSKWYKDE